MKLTDVIRRPLITEKTTLLREDGRTLVFEVAPAAESSLEASLRSAVGAAKPKLTTNASPAAAKTALNDTRLREVYDAYVMAKKRCNEDTSRLSYDSVASSLKKQVPDLLKKHNARDVDFKVIIKDGKAVLKAVPKE